MERNGFDPDKNTWGTKAEVTKGHIQPQYGEPGSQQPNGHSTQLAHGTSRLQSPHCLPAEGRAKRIWSNSSKIHQPGSDLPSPCAQLSWITAKLGTHSCPGQTRGQDLMKKKSFNKTHTGMCHWEKHGLPLFSLCLSLNSFPWGSRV